MMIGWREAKNAIGDVQFILTNFELQGINVGEDNWGVVEIIEEILGCAVDVVIGIGGIGGIRVHQRVLENVTDWVWF